jgi:hypothetical protein
MRLAEAIDKGQADGEITAHGGDRSKVHTTDLADIGVDKRRLSEWRDLRDAGTEAVDAAIQEQVDEGKAPTKSAIKSRLNKRTGSDGKTRAAATPKQSAKEKLKGGRSTRTLGAIEKVHAPPKRSPSSASTIELPFAIAEAAPLAIKSPAPNRGSRSDKTKLRPFSMTTGSAAQLQRSNRLIPGTRAW